MNEIEIVKELLKAKGMSYAVLAKAMGRNTASGVGNRLAGRSMTVEVLLEMLKAMNCELIIKHTIGEKETYVVENENRVGNERTGKKKEVDIDE